MIPPQNRFLRSPNPPHLRSSLRSCFGALFCLGAFLSFFFGALSEAQAHCCCFVARGGRFFGAWEDQFVNENLEGFDSFFLFWERFWGLGSLLLAWAPKMVLGRFWGAFFGTVLALFIPPKTCTTQSWLSRVRRSPGR